MNIRRIILAAVAFTAGFYLHLPNARAQGSLTPPGAPAPTMKTLDQIEARIPVDQAHTPPDSNSLFAISAPGSYYLTGNITGASNLSGIEIYADNVTIDLNGFAMIGSSNSICAIAVWRGHSSLRVYNGTLQNWPNYSLEAHLTFNGQFDHLRMCQNGGGLDCGDSCDIHNCVAYGNTQYYGILTGVGSTFSGCTVTSNHLDGIYAAAQCTLTGCTATANANGFNLGEYCTLVGCTATANSKAGFTSIGFSTFKDCTAMSNSGKGIDSTFGNGVTLVNCNASGNLDGGIIAAVEATITGCNANNNTGDGIAFGTDCFVSGNNANNNTGNGLNSLVGANRIDGNSANNNTKAGILWINDFVVRNAAFLNGTNYTPAVGGGNTGPVNAASASTNPWANF